MATPSAAHQAREGSATSPGPGAKVLVQGLELLRLLAQANGPVSATELARTTGQHPSSVSRILSGLAKAGYIRKPDYRSFSIDLGLVTLLGQARQHFPVIASSRPVLAEQAAMMPGTRLSLATLYEHQLIYWLIVEAGHDAIDLIGGGYPLHLSSIALRLLVDTPRDEALRLLGTSHRWFGWERPTKAIPDDAATVLKTARRLVTDDALMLVGWQSADSFSVAIPLRGCEPQPLALALSGNIDAMRSEQQAIKHVRATRARLEQILANCHPIHHARNTP